MGKLIIHPIPLLRVIDRFGKPKMTYLYNFGEDVDTCCFVWYIEGANEKILVDAGLAYDTTIKRGRPKELVTAIQTVEDGLAKYNLTPADIDKVIITHLHWDHIELGRKFVNAKFVVQEEELRIAKDPELAGEGYVQELLTGLDFETVRGDAQITDGIRVMLTPGHTVGGQSVVVETEKGNAVFPGFCCIRENFEPREEIRKKVPFIVPGVHIDVPQCQESMRKVIEAADIIVPLHEFEYLNIDTIP